MIYPQNFEQKTGFDKVRRLISEKCLSPLGEERVAEMGFSTDYQTVTQRLEQTDEFVRILHGEDEFPASYFFDVRYSLKRIRPATDRKDRLHTRQVRTCERQCLSCPGADTKRDHGHHERHLPQFAIHTACRTIGRSRGQRYHAYHA